MASTKTPMAIADAFIRDAKAPVKLDSMFVEDYTPNTTTIGTQRNVLVSYGTHYPLMFKTRAWVTQALLINRTKSTATTNRHIQGCILAALANGYVNTYNQYEIDGMVFDVYLQMEVK